MMIVVERKLGGAKSHLHESERLHLKRLLESVILAGADSVQPQLMQKQVE